MTDAPPVTALSASECVALLRATPLGRIALAVGGEVDIFPINYVLDDEDRIVFRTAPGTKLAELVISPSVAFEIDGVIEGQIFSVIVKGEAARIESATEIAEAEALPLRPWIATVKEQFVRITPSWTTGRRFTPGPEPELDPAATPSA